jgi:hypothetical protein
MPVVKTATPTEWENIWVPGQARGLRRREKLSTPAGTKLPLLGHPGSLINAPA